MQSKTKSVDLWYPRTESPNRSDDEPTEVSVGLTDVRAANSIVVDYDFERDGYRIRMASVMWWELDDKECDPKLVEVGFVPAWATGEPDDDSPTGLKAKP